MKGPEDTVEWTQIINRRASTQIMILVSLLMTDDEVFATLNS